MGILVPTSEEVAGALAGQKAEFDRGLADVRARLAALEGKPRPATWLSGGNPDNNTQTGAEQFGRWRGKKCTCALAYPVRDGGWGPLTSATALPQGVWTDKAVKLVVQLPMFPQGNYTYAACAAGTYREQHKQLGANWHKREKAGFERPVFMLTWEHNHRGPGMHYWGGPGPAVQQFHDYDEFVGAFRQTVEAVRETYPEAEFGFVGNGHDSPGYGAGRFPANDPRNTYPGREYVDWIGVDYYDHFPPSFGGTSTSSRRKDFDVESREVNGVRWWMEFALAEGTGFAVPEWACNSGDVAGGDHGGDNPSFVANMKKVFDEAAAKGLDVLECYYEDTAQKLGVMNGQNPKAAQKYLELFGG